MNRTCLLLLILISLPFCYVPFQEFCMRLLKFCFIVVEDQIKKASSEVIVPNLFANFLIHIEAEIICRLYLFFNYFTIFHIYTWLDLADITLWTMNGQMMERFGNFSIDYGTAILNMNATTICTSNRANLHLYKGYKSLVEIMIVDWAITGVFYVFVLFFVMITIATGIIGFTCHQCDRLKWTWREFYQMKWKERMDKSLEKK